MAVKKTKKATKRNKAKTKSAAKRAPARTKGKGARKKPLGGKVRIRVSHNRVSTKRSEFKNPLGGDMVGGHNRRAVERELETPALATYAERTGAADDDSPVVVTTDAEGNVASAGLVCTEDSVLGGKDDVETADEDDVETADEDDSSASDGGD